MTEAERIAVNLPRGELACLRALASIEGGGRATAADVSASIHSGGLTMRPTPAAWSYVRLHRLADEGLAVHRDYGGQRFWGTTDLGRAVAAALREGESAP